MELPFHFPSCSAEISLIAIWMLSAGIWALASPGFRFARCKVGLALNRRLGLVKIRLAGRCRFGRFKGMSPVPSLSWGAHRGELAGTLNNASADRVFTYSIPLRIFAK
jgi:hypothetical protein